MLRWGNLVESSIPSLSEPHVAENASSQYKTETLVGASPVPRPKKGSKVEPPNNHEMNPTSIM